VLAEFPEIRLPTFNGTIFPTGKLVNRSFRAQWNASLPRIEQIISVKLLGIHLTAVLCAAVHVEHILSLANQCLHLLGLLKYQGLSPEALHLIFTPIVQSVITYALPSYAGQLSKGDKSRINALFRKSLKRSLCDTHSST